MPIGQFSKSCRLSIKALRHYDDIGLLRPEHVDANSGYRYYAKSQAKKAVMIAMLRLLDIPISVISEMLDSHKENLHRLVEQQKQQLSHELAHKRSVLNSLERISDSGQLIPFDIAIREDPACIVASRSRKIPLDKLLKESAELIYDLYNELQTFGRDFVNPVMCINSDPDKSDLVKVIACIGVNKPYPALKESSIIDIEGGKVAWLMLRGPYEELGLAFHSLFAWAQENGYQQRAAMREIYLNDPSQVPANELMTEVILPIEAIHGGKEGPH